MNTPTSSANTVLHAWRLNVPTWHRMGMLAQPLVLYTYTGVVALGLPEMVLRQRAVLSRWPPSSLTFVI